MHGRTVLEAIDGEEAGFVRMNDVCNDCLFLAYCELVRAIWALGVGPGGRTAFRVVGCEYHSDPARREVGFDG